MQKLPPTPVSLISFVRSLGKTLAMCGGAILSDLYSPVRRTVTAGDLWGESGSTKNVKNWKRRSSWKFDEDGDDFEADFEDFNDCSSEEEVDFVCEEKGL